MKASALLLALVPATAAADIVFKDVTAAAGVTFVHEAGKAGGKLLPETMGAGVAVFDADGDGWLDLFFVNGRRWKAGGKPVLPALYLSEGGQGRPFRFRDATKGSGLDAEHYGMGAAVGDFDNDGRPDLYVTSLDGDRLYRNEGGGRFRDVTKGSGIDNRDFGTSAAWLDYDKDGKADLFVANYVTWNAATDAWCSLDGTTKSYCTPQTYKGIASKLYRNLGGGRFEDVSAAAGVADPTAKSLGVAVLDLDADGWPDLFVANDTQPNKLYKNVAKGGRRAFVDVALEAGVAFGEDGAARGAMGVDVADWDGSGRPHVVVGNYAGEMIGLYRNEGGGLFTDRAPSSPVGRVSLPTLAWAVFLFDYDLDGRVDLFAANGHLEEEIERVQPGARYLQAPQLFRNAGGGHFADASGAVGPDLARPLGARGAAYGDLDRDGDLDLVVTQNGGPAVLFRNDGGDANHWLAVRLAGTRSNASGLGAVVRVETAAGAQWRAVHSGSSYCSQSDLALTFGLGREAHVRALVVTWPSGLVERFANLPADQLVVVEEGRGIVEGRRAATPEKPAPERAAAVDPAGTHP